MLLLTFAGIGCSSGANYYQERREAAGEGGSEWDSRRREGVGFILDGLTPERFIGDMNATFDEVRMEHGAHEYHLANGIRLVLARYEEVIPRMERRGYRVVPMHEAEDWARYDIEAEVRRVIDEFCTDP